MLFLIAVTTLGAYAPTYAPTDSFAEVEHRTIAFEVAYPAFGFEVVDYSLVDVVEKAEWSVPEVDRVEPATTRYTPSASVPARLASSERAVFVETLSRD